MPSFDVPANTTPTTVKDFLRYKIGLSLTAWRKVKQIGEVKVNSKLALPNTIVNPGDIITINCPSNCTIPPANIPIVIKYEDPYLLVVDKPANMLVHPTKHTDINTLANAVINYYQQKHITHGFHPVHRLDRNTSGLILIAKLPYIQHLFDGGGIKKVHRVYWGIAEGVITPSDGIIHTPIRRNPNSIIERMVHPEGQSATTIYRVIKNLHSASLVELELQTGRTHQIRVHLASIGHPLLGDDLYGGSTNLICRQALHAVKLSFKHPVTGEPINIISTLPDDIQKIISLLSQ